METQMLDRQSSYFEFLMKNRSLRGPRVAFAQATGVLPALAHTVRVTQANARLAADAA
jgi:hypothetical protein